MQHTAFDGPLTLDGELDARDQFNVVILYDRAEAGRRAMSQLRKVTDPLAAGLDLQVRLWRLDVVLDSTVAKTVAADLATADLLVVALDEDGSAEANARDGLLEALNQMRSQGAAMAILTGGVAAMEPSRFDFLRQAAREAGIGLLFPSAGNVPAGTDSFFSAVHNRATAMTPVLERILNEAHPRPRWGHHGGSL